MTNVKDIPLLTKTPGTRPGRKIPVRIQRCRKLLGHLEKSQWWTPERMLAFQFKQLRPLLKYTYNNVPFYKQKWDSLGLSLEDVTPENWHKVPILSRSELQAETILSQEVPPQHGKVMSTSTSGSTGQPVTIHGTSFSQIFFDAINIRDSLWHKRDMTRKHAAIKYYPDGKIPPHGVFSPAWTQTIKVLFGSGSSGALNIRTPIDQQLDWLKRFNPEYLLTYPSNLHALIERLNQTDTPLPNLREVRTISEVVPQKLRDECAQSLGVKLTDAYSSQELGGIALQCPKHQHYHVQSESIFLEILNDNDEPCKPGEIGRIVMTSLLNYATPLIRYEIRDYAEVGEPCDCGRGLQVINRIVGRQRNLLSLPNGEKTWPFLGWARYKEVAPVHQFQFIQHSLEEIEMRLVADRSLRPAEEEKLKKVVQESLGHKFNVLLTPMNEIIQGANGKYEEFISRIDDASPDAGSNKRPSAEPSRTAAT